MKRTNFRNLVTTLLLTIALISPAATELHAQRGGPRTDSRILYHSGAVMAGTSTVYVIWYGNWSGNNTPSIMIDLITSLGSSPYFRLNAAYPDSSGAAPNGALIYAASVYDAYSHGSTLSDQDIEEIAVEHIGAGTLPLDPHGIYLIIASADITNIRPDGSSYCTPGATPYHSAGEVFATTVKYGFIGSAARCPTTAGSQFTGGWLPPNGSLEADAMASTVARLVSAVVTNPLGNAWYDRYGLQNSDKCAGTFGTTYTTPNGGQANMRLGQRDYLIQQNWVNARKGRCALSEL